MITQITKIKNLGVFHDYSADRDLKNFNKFNLIYGWNGTGKTTLSELFIAFNDGVLKKYPNLEYQFKAGNQIYSQSKPYDKIIRVFNQNYIIKNINIIESKANSIFILGEENEALLKTIQQDEKILNGDPEKENDLGKIKELSLKQQKLEDKKEEKNRKFTDTARIISANTSGVSARNYNKRNAETAFERLDGKTLLPDNKIQQNRITLKQQQKSVLSLIDLGFERNFEQIILESASILEHTVETVIIDRLKDHADISKWVEDGINLHIVHESATCEFCNQSLPENRIPDLLSYFNDADKVLKSNIDILLDKIRGLYYSIDKLVILDKANLYDELQEDYEHAIKEVEKERNALLLKIKELINTVDDKKQHTTEQLTLSINIDKTHFIQAIANANSLVEDCNEKTANFAEGKKNAEEELEKHHLSEIYDDVKTLSSRIQKLESDIEKLKNGSLDEDDIGINGIKQRISDNRIKISSSGTACNEINIKLQTFLGRNELTFEVAEEGYAIKRKGEIAKNLSEGEKTAIAFVYFIIHLQDQDFNLANGIVVIDDPISSLDSNSIFQAFSFLKNATKDAEQVFILTHNFDFLRLLLGWLEHDSKNAQYYMIRNNHESNNNRVAILDTLDNLLKKYHTEYQYLFKLLSTFKSDGTIASVYHIPNIARKTLEYFLSVMVPNNESMFNKMQKLDFDQNKKSAIYKFVNAQSHMTGNDFNPSLVPECQKNVEYLLEMIKEVFPAHYKIIDNIQ